MCFINILWNRTCCHEVRVLAVNRVSECNRVVIVNLWLTNIWTSVMHKWFTSSFCSSLNCIIWYKSWFPRIKRVLTTSKLRMSASNNILIFQCWCHSLITKLHFFRNSCFSSSIETNCCLFFSLISFSLSLTSYIVARVFTLHCWRVCEFQFSEWLFFFR
jgi:hypothetical protein